MNQSHVTQQMKRTTSETADRLRQTLLAGHPNTTQLVVSGLSTYLQDEQAVAELARRALTGENVFGALVREVIQAEAEQIAHATAAAALEAA